MIRKSLAVILAYAVVSMFSADAQAEDDADSAFNINRILAANGCSEPTANLSVFERVEPARDYTTCVQTAFARERAKAAKSGNIAAISAFDSLGSAQVERAVRLENIALADSEFRGLNWGLGFGFSLGEDDFIEAASIVDGVVRVSDDRTQRARVLLEFHRYFWCDKNNDAQSGCGPFIALAAESDDVLKGVGVGFMWGWRGKDPEASDGFSIGIGAVLDNDVKSLADGFIENQPPPGNETEVRLRQESRWSALLFMTRTF